MEMSHLRRHTRGYGLRFITSACTSAVYAVVQCLSVTFVYCVETAKDTAIAAMARE